MQAVFLELIKLSLIGSLFAGAVMLVRLIFPKAPRWIFCLLWGVVALRLICPLSIESSISLVPDGIASGQIIASVGNEYIGDVDIIRENDTAYDSAVEAGRQPVYSEDGYYVVTEKDSLEVPKTVGETLYPVLSWIWAAGTVSMLIYTVVSFLVLRRKMAEATRLRDNIWQCERVDSPFVLGFIKPKIYLPYSITDSDMANVIAHEQAHIHRRDHWWKPIGFILLSLHWFNPVLWLAYVMLCRDIEAACDEKVIKHMEKDEMRAYSTALLNCSVNRRRIAACPLAFGEVGVKERVKTVMNYKKPAFWIVIAAVALCIVVAVCFLTNPKTPGPEVDDPTMLEFPGLKWGMTVEEVKEALNITEDQISTDKHNSDLHLLHVKDITFFGEDVSIGLFKFLPVDAENLGLSYVMLFLDEDTDMDKLQTTLSDSYNNQGTGEYFMGYSLSTGSAIHINVDPDELEYKLYEYKRCLDWKVDDNGNFQSGSIFAQEQAKNIFEKINEPGLKTYNWVSPVKAAEVIDPEDLDVIKEAYERYLDIDPSLTGEWLEKSPLVHMSMANRSEQAIRAELEGVTEGELTLATNNIVVLDAQMLFNLQNDILRAQMANAAMLEFPGLKWGASVEEVKDALNLTDEQVIADEALGTQDRRLTVSGLEYFGSQVERAVFVFAGNDDTVTELYTLRLIYADGTDMAQIRDNMKEIYGSGSDYGFTDYAIHDGEAQSFINYNYGTKVEYGTAMSDDIVYKVPDNHPMIHRWASTAKGTDILSQEVVDAFIALYTDPTFANHASREAVLEWIDKHPWVTVTCSNGTVGFQDPLCSVSFAAEFIPMKWHAKSWMEKNSPSDTTLPTDPPVTPATQSEILASIPDVDEVSMLCFPGLKWGDSVETVKTVLGVKEEQIKLDEPYGDAYHLWLENVSFFGGDIASGQFRFLEKNGEYYLESIKLYYVDGTDMTAVEDALRDQYGAPKDGEGFTVYTISNGTVKSRTEPAFTYDFDKDKTKVKSWWESAAKRADLLPADVLEAMVENGHVTYYTERLNPADPPTRPLIQEYLNSDPAVLLYCTNGEKLGQIPYTKNVVSFNAHLYVYQLLYCR